jgi:CheY-like chemotaxis protein
VRLTQVIANLLNNASKYSETGGAIALEVGREGNTVRISVRDSGAGIAAEMLPRVFDMFVTAGEDPSRMHDGLGIGLTLVKSLVELHGGSVCASSGGKGLGSEFVVRLPLVQAESVIARAPTRPTGAPAELGSRRILVVDDNHDAAESVATLLRMLGAEVEVAYGGPEALKAVAHHRPNAILMDIGMPGMDGHETARRIREQPELDDVVLIALTGWGQEADRRRARETGFDHHLTKPADVHELRCLLESFVARPASTS